MHRKLSKRIIAYAASAGLLIALGIYSSTSISEYVNTSSAYAARADMTIPDDAELPIEQLPSVAPRPTPHHPTPVRLVRPATPVPAPQAAASPQPAVVKLAASTYETTAYYLNVRANAYSSSKILNVVEKGTLLEVVDKTDNGWLRLKDGGYVHGNYAKPVPPAESVESIGSSENSGLLMPLIDSGRYEMVSASANASAESLTALTDGDEETTPEKPTSKVASDSGLDETHIAEILEGTALADQGLEKAILEVEAEYGINAFFTIAVMKLESGNGKSKLAKVKNNLFGLNAVSGDAYNKAFSFKAKEDSVRKFGELMFENYVEKGYTTIEKVAKKYCPANSKWPSHVKNIMDRDFRKI